MSHSKRNTSLAFFTAHERNELKGHWGSRSTRLGRDSFLPFGSCQLCLEIARDPIACPSHGHLFCRECAINNLLAQGKERKRLKKEAEKRKVEEAEEKEVGEQEARARALEEFEKVQAGLDVSGGGKADRRIIGRNNGKVTVEQTVDEGDKKGVKRKFEVAEEDLKKLAAGESSVKKQATEGKRELPSFWVPSETPDNKKADLKAIKQQPTCPAGAADQPHDFSLKTLVTVKFTEDQPSNGADVPSRTCPSCNKVLSNATKAVLAKPCGHVLCKPCSQKFQRAPEKSAHDNQHDDVLRCYVCQEDVTPGRRGRRKLEEKDGEGEKSGKPERGLVEIFSEGTGFGDNMVKKAGVAFQC